MIRPRTPADLPALERALRALHEADGYPSVWPSDPRGFLTPPSLGAWVAEARGQVVGQVVLRPVADPLPGWVAATGLAAPDVLVVSRLFVAVGARGQGLARGLLRTAWQEAQDRGQRAILNVERRNRGAVQLYEAEGWWRVATASGDWTEPDGTVPQVHVYVAPQGAPQPAMPSLNPA